MPCRIDKLNQYTSGWTAYFHLADIFKVFRVLHEWFRRRMRQIVGRNGNGPRPVTATLR